MGYQMAQYAAMLDRQFASSSPAPSISRNQEDDIPRPMNLRILYTFDLRAENQCLAKLQHALPIHTVALPDGSQLGITNLKTCLQAILKASPEIYSEETDYTVYAYDPSEQGTPRVGHGRLSQIIQTNDFSEEDQIMVNGVVKNNLALLATSQQVQDNLEIRLALTPVQTRGRNDSGSRSPFLQERAPSPHITGYPDVNNLMNLNKIDPQYLMFLQAAAANPQAATMEADAFQRFMASTTNTFQASRSASQNNFSAFQPPNLNSRPASPAPSVASNASNSSRRPMKRTASNISRSNIPELPSALSQVDAGYFSGDEIAVPKRARVVQADRPGKNVLSKKGDLRVVASAAASVRVHQPTAVRPHNHPGQALEEPQRIPTPVPQGNNFLQRRTSTARSSLGLHAENSFSRDSHSPYSESNLPSLPNSAVTSPEGMFGAVGTPDELGSSPPVIPGIDACPSSPALPPLPIHDDSGFMSGGLNDMSEMENEDSEVQCRNTRPMLPPPKIRRVIFTEPQVLRTSTANIQPLPRNSASAARSALGIKTSPPPSSDALSESVPSKKPRGRPSRTDENRPPWDKEKRRLAMVAKLNNSVANGEIPPYCHNCGVIETPTWRKAFTKVHSGDAPLLVIPKGGVKEDGAIIGLEIIKQDATNGKTQLFRIYKKTLLESDETFEPISLCNPCGLWLKNRGINRPEKLWSKGNDDESRIHEFRERERRPRLARGDEEPQSDMTEIGQAVAARTSQPVLSRQSSTISEPPAPTNNESEELQSAPSKTKPGRDHGADSAVAPPETSGCEEDNERVTPGNRKSPIELDKGDPSPVRRSLFSSPRSSGPLGVDIKSKSSPVKNFVALDADEPDFTPMDDVDEYSGRLSQSDKIAETQPTLPPSTPTRKALQLPPVTPMHSSTAKDSAFSRSPSNLFKTPSIATGGTPNNHRVTTSDFFSSSAKNLLHGAPTNDTPSKIGGRSPIPDDGRLSPQLPRILQNIYGSPSPDNEDFSDMFGVNMEQLFADCCPGYPIHKESCPKRVIMMNQPGYDAAILTSEFPGTDEDWAEADAFFNSSGLTGFTPRKPLEATVAQDDDNEVDTES